MNTSKVKMFWEDTFTQKLICKPSFIKITLHENYTGLVYLAYSVKFWCKSFYKKNPKLHKIPKSEMILLLFIDIPDFTSKVVLVVLCLLPQRNGLSSGVISIVFLLQSRIIWSICNKKKLTILLILNSHSFSDVTSNVYGPVFYN